ncbi:MAG: peptidoglycan editing factor PgeF [Rhizobiaceae bacterium]|nr:peptidoglycan editing factor PgeF [Rhizobiaceae bacterium]
MTTTTMPEPIVSPLLEGLAASGIRHGYFTRTGGVSEGIYKGLNTGTGSSDDPAKVRENRERVAAWMGVEIESLMSAHQIHSPDALVVREPFSGPRPKVDALVTDRPGIAVGASSADCGPILFVEPQARVIGAAHAGWKGALTGVLESTVDAMISLGAERERIRAALGPSISQANYEVGPEFVERFIEQDRDNAAYFTMSANAGHSMFDLNSYTVDRLRKAGVQAEALYLCTYADDALFYSYRRSTHRREPDYGRHISAIVMEEG